MSGPDSTVGVGGSDSTIDVAGTPAQPARAPQHTPDTRTDYASLELIPPEHYVVNEQLARGGMGRVTRARDRRLGRDVAIKSLVRNTPELAARLEREARITARLQHPAIVDVHEAGMWPGGEPFYAMELVTGRPFGEAIAKTKTLAERLGLLPNVIAVADALAYAHAQKIIHRDLKPSNVLVGEYGETVVIDWGLAKDLAGGAPEPMPDRTPAATPEETVAGSIMGTPAYMPPEQAAGKPVDERADVYALGAMLYHVLAGVPPYIGDTSDAVLAAVAAGPPRPIAERAPGAPSDLITIVSKAMAYDARDRYPTARELADDLKKFQTGQLVGSHRYTMWQLVKRWLRRYRAAASIAGVLLVVLAVVSIWGLQRIIRERAVAEEQQHLAEEQQKVAEREAARARKAEAQVQAELDQLKAEQAARTRAEAEARAKGTEAEMSKEEALAALKRAENEKTLAEQQKRVAEQESQRAKEAEARAEAATAAEKKTSEEARRLYEEEKRRVKALEDAKAKGITTTLPK